VVSTGVANFDRDLLISIFLTGFTLNGLYRSTYLHPSIFTCPGLARTVVAPRSSVVKCLWGVFVWGVGVLFLSCACVCVCVCRCR